MIEAPKELRPTDLPPFLGLFFHSVRVSLVSCSSGQNRKASRTNMHFGKSQQSGERGKDTRLPFAQIVMMGRDARQSVHGSIVGVLRSFLRSEERRVGK